MPHLKIVTLDEVVSYLTATYNLNWSNSNGTYRISKMKILC